MGFSVFGKTVKSAYFTGLFAFCVVIENHQKWAEKVSIFDTIRENGVRTYAILTAEILLDRNLTQTA